MPANASIAINNGEATPVSHTYAPLGRDPSTGVWWFEDQSPRVSSTSSLGWPRLGIKSSRSSRASPGDSAQSQVNRVQLTFALPQMEALGTSDSGLTPSPTVAYVDRVKIEFLLPVRDLIADRKDALAFAKNCLANTIVVDLVQNLTSIY